MIGQCGFWALEKNQRNSLIFNGRGGQIRTDDFLLPKQALYQAELRPDALVRAEDGSREKGWQANPQLIFSKSSKNFERELARVAGHTRQPPQGREGDVNDGLDGRYSPSRETSSESVKASRLSTAAIRASSSTTAC